MTAAPPLLRNSERGDFKRCPWLWEQVWLKGYTTRRVPTWAWFGTAIHKGLEVRYPVGNKRGSVADMIDAFVESCEDQTRKIYSEGGEFEEDEVVDGIELGKTMLLGYVEEYGEDKQWEVIHSEQSFQIDVPDPLDPSKVIVVQAGTWDAFVRDKVEKDFWVIDHKTRKTFPSNWDFYDINDQAGTYLWVAPEVLTHMGVITKKEAKKIQGLIFNALRKHMPDVRPTGPDGKKHNSPNKAHFYEALKDHYELNPNRLPAIPVLAEMANEQKIQVWGDVSARQPSPLFHRQPVERSLQERVQQGQRVQQEAQWMREVREGRMPAFKTPTEDCVRCIMFEYCAANEYDKEEGEELARTILRHRDPYRDHREAMQEGGIELHQIKSAKKKKGK